MILIQTIDWDAVGKIWGPLGIIFVVFILGVVAIAKLVKQFLNDTVTDARKERDYMRDLRNKEVDQFLASLKYRDDKMAEQFTRLIEEFKDTRAR